MKNTSKFLKKNSLWIIVLMIILFMNCPKNDSRPAFFVSLTNFNGETRSHFSPSGESWPTHFVHEDMPPLIKGDIAIDKSNGISQYIAFFYQKPDQKWYILIKTGLGATTWSQEYIQKEVPHNTQPYQIKMDYLFESTFGLVWAIGDTIFTALFEPLKPQGERITLSQPFVSSLISDFDIRSLSLTYLNGHVYLALSRASNSNSFGNRTVLICQGNINNNNGIDFSDIYSINQNITSSSNIITHNDSLYLAVSQDMGENSGQFVLLASADGSNWETISSCEKESYQYIDKPFMFADKYGHIKCLVIDLYNPEGAHIHKIIDFNGCTDSPFGDQFGSGAYDYYPGTI